MDFEDHVDFIEDIRQIPSYLKVLTQVDSSWDIFYTDVDCRAYEVGFVPNIVLKPARPSQQIMP